MILLSEFCKGDGEADDSGGFREALAAAVAQAEEGGTAILQGSDAAVYKLGSGGGIELPRNLAGYIEFRGEGCTIKLTEKCRRLFDVVREGERKHDVVRNFSAQDFILDADSFHKKEKSEHALFGNFIEGTIQRYISVENVKFRRIRVTNLYTHGGDGATVTTRAAVRLYVKQTNLRAEEETQDFIKELLFEEVRIEGGLGGLDIGAETQAGGVANVYCDDVVYRDCFHSTGQEIAEIENSSSCNFQIGHNAIGGRYLIENCIGELSADVGVELDSPTFGVVRDCVIKNARSICFLAASQSTPAEGLATTHFQCCEAIRRRESSKCIGFKTSGGAGTKSTGARVYYDDCWMHSERALLEANNDAWQIEDSVSLVSVTNSGAHFKVAYSSASNVTPVMVHWGPTATGGRLFIRNFEARLSGKRESKAGELSPSFLQLSGSGLTSELDVDAFTIISELEGATAGGQFVRVAVSATEVTFHGRLGVKVLADGDDTKARGIYVFQGARVDGELILTGDMRGMDGAEAQSVVFQSGLPEATQAKIKQRNLIAKTLPVLPSDITVGASSFTYRNLDGFMERVIVREGTVSAIEISSDGENWKNVGAIAGAYLLDQGDSIKVTYTVKPTMHKVPML